MLNYDIDLYTLYKLNTAKNITLDIPFSKKNNELDLACCIEFNAATAMKSAQNFK